MFKDSRRTELKFTCKVVFFFFKRGHREETEKDFTNMKKK